MDKCPRCNSPQPHLHPAMQFEGEVQPCSHPFHEQLMTDTPDIVERLHAKRFSATAKERDIPDELLVKAADEIERLRRTCEKRDETALAFEKQAMRAEQVIAIAAEVAEAGPERDWTVLMNKLRRALGDYQEQQK